MTVEKLKKNILSSLDSLNKMGLWKIFLFQLLFVILIINFFNTEKFITLLFLGGITLLPLLALKEILNILINSKKEIINIVNNLILLSVSIFSALFLLEIGIRTNRMHRTFYTSKEEIPQELAQRNLQVQGAQQARMWQGKLHVYRDGFRRTSDFPPKQENVFRIIVIGDSITYGTGIALEDTYTQLLEKELKNDFRVEVLNLGYDGAQPSDLLITLQKYVSFLKPDLVIYGVCQNDIMPDGKQPYKSNQNYLFPIPERFKQFMIKKTAIGGFYNYRYDQLLLKTGLRKNYLGDFIDGYYQDSFFQSVKELNDYVLGKNLPPIVAMVLDNTPNETTKEVTLIIEDLLVKAGMKVIPTEDYYQKYLGSKFVVSQWEPHPNEQAHEIFAQYYFNYLRQLPILKGYKIK